MSQRESFFKAFASSISADPVGPVTSSVDSSLPNLSILQTSSTNITHVDARGNNFEKPTPAALTEGSDSKASHLKLGLGDTSKLKKNNLSKTKQRPKNTTTEPEILTQTQEYSKIHPADMLRSSSTDSVQNLVPDSRRKRGGAAFLDSHTTIERPDSERTVAPRQLNTNECRRKAPRHSDTVSSVSTLVADDVSREWTPPRDERNRSLRVPSSPPRSPLAATSYTNNQGNFQSEIRMPNSRQFPRSRSTNNETNLKMGARRMRDADSDELQPEEDIEQPQKRPKHGHIEGLNINSISAGSPEEIQELPRPLDTFNLEGRSSYYDVKISQAPHSTQSGSFGSSGFDDYYARQGARVQTLKEKWQNCTLTEWHQGGLDIASQFSELIEFVSNGMTAKVAAFGELHGRVENQSKVLDMRADRLHKEKARLISDGGNVLK